MKIKMIIAILALAVLGGCGEKPEKDFGQRTLPDGTIKVERVEYPNGDKQFDKTIFPDGSTTFARSEFAEGDKHFDVTILPDGTTKTGRLELSSGEKQFDKTQHPDGSVEIAHYVLPNGNENFNCTSPDSKTWKCGGLASLSAAQRHYSPSSISQNDLKKLADMQDPTCFGRACMQAIEKHDAEQEEKRLYGQDKSGSSEDDVYKAFSRH